MKLSLTKHKDDTEDLSIYLPILLLFVTCNSKYKLLLGGQLCDKQKQILNTIIALWIR